jgi:hypothetical protein
MGGRLAILQYNIAIQNDRGTILYSLQLVNFLEKNTTFLKIA